ISLHFGSFSADSTRLIGSHWGANTAMSIWEIPSGRKILTLTNASSVNPVSFTPDGRSFLGIGADNTVGLWDANSGQRLKVFQGHNDSVAVAAMSADGKRIFSGGRDKTAR